MTPRRDWGWLRWAAPLAWVLFGAGCATSGAGTGTLVEPGAPESGERVVFRWDSGLDPTEGELRTQMPDGTTYRGRYFQITETIQDDNLAPLWDGWGAYWPSWDAPWGSYYYPGEGFDTFTRIYSGRVVATLEGPDGERMRCRFALAEPTEGLAGGAQGECQLEGGGEIEYAVIGPVA